MSVATRIPYAFVGAALVTAVGSFAQPMAPVGPAQLQQRYEARIAECNRSDLPAPARNACVRAAGAALDRTLGGPPPETELETRDGRATVIAPRGSIAPRAGSDTVTSDDGRATIVVPADGVGTPR